MRLFIQVLMIAALAFFIFNPGSNTTDDNLVSCWHHHCEYGDQQILCYRPVYDCDLQPTDADRPDSELKLSCVPSSEWYPPKPDLYCENDFFSDCTCGYKKSGDEGQLNRTEPAYCLCEMNYKLKATIVIVVLVFILLMGGMASSLGFKLWFLRRKYDVSKSEGAVNSAYSRYD